MGAHYSGNAPRPVNFSGLLKVLLWTALVGAVLYWLVLAGGSELGAVVTDWFQRL
jgi:hypothetical protein